MTTLQTEASASPLFRLEAALRGHDRLLVAYSGGVDSGVLLGVAAKVLGARVVAVTADSPSMARRELREAAIFARQLGVEHRVVQTSELSLEEYSRNASDRCFWCKQTLFAACEEIARSEGFSAVAYGYNADDAHDHRPGHRAAENFGVIAPLFDAGLTKNEVRGIASELGYEELSDKPAAPCLASRVPYGSTVTDEKLARIEGVEDLLHELGFRIFRARFDGTLMRLELEESEIARAVEPQVRRQLMERARQLGVPLLTIDLEGFRSGRLNELTSS